MVQRLCLCFGTFLNIVSSSPALPHGKSPPQLSVSATEWLRRQLIICLLFLYLLTLFKVFVLFRILRVRDCGKRCEYHLTSLSNWNILTASLCVCMSVAGCRDKWNLSEGRRSSCQASGGGYLCAVQAAEDTEPATG